MQTAGVDRGPDCTCILVSPALGSFSDCHLGNSDWYLHAFQCMFPAAVGLGDNAENDGAGPSHHCCHSGTHAQQAR